jgi:hypothetical protein
MTYKQAAQAALDVQNASNLSGVCYTLAQAMEAVCDEAYKHAHGTEWKNSHPIVTLFLLKMAELNGCGSTLDPSYGPAEDACRAILLQEV